MTNISLKIKTNNFLLFVMNNHYAGHRPALFKNLLIPACAGMTLKQIPIPLNYLGER